MRNKKNKADSLSRINKDIENIYNSDLISISDSLKDDYQIFLEERKSMIPLTQEERDLIESKIRLGVLQMFSRASELAKGDNQELGFFRYEDIFKIPYVNDYFNIFVANGDRNIGKSYSSQRMVRNVVKNGKKFMWWRNIDDEIKAQLKSDLNGGWIAKLGWNFTGSAKMPDIVDLNHNIVGYYRALNTSAKFKSTDFPDTDIIIYEEYNAVSISDKPLKMIKMISTIQRFNPNLKVILQANYTDQNDDILQFLGIGSKKLTKKDIVIFNWEIGSIIINIPKNIYRKPKNKTTNVAYRASLGDYSIWKSQYGGGFANEEPVNIISEKTFASIKPVFNIFIFNSTTFNKNIKKYGAYKLTLYHVYDEMGKKHNILREMVGSNSKPIFVFDHLNQIKYPTAHLISLEALDGLIDEWNRGNLKTINTNTHEVITSILASGMKMLMQNKKEIEEVENMIN